MKKIFTLSLLTVASFSFGQASDAFAYDGALNANGWTTHSGATPGQIVTAAGSLTYKGLTTQGNKVVLVAGNSEDINLASAAPITDVAYFSAIINVKSSTELDANTNNGSYFMALGPTAGTSLTAYNGRIYNRQGSQPDTFNLGVINNSSGSAVATFSAVDYPIGTPVFVVVKFELANNTASLFVNPTIGQAEGTALVTSNAGTGAAPAQIASVAIRQAGTATLGTGNVEIDEVRIGNSWTYVTASTLGVSENQIEGLKMYPNPVANGLLYITSNTNVEKEVVIFDILGKEMLHTVISENTLNVANLKSGNYLVKITEEGKTSTRQLVIE